MAPFRVRPTWLYRPGVDNDRNQNNYDYDSSTILYKVKPDYAERDRAKGKEGMLAVEGERAYQVCIGAPSEGLPRRVDFVKS